MKASELIKTLQESILSYGDRKVIFEYCVEVGGVDGDYCIKENGFIQDCFNLTS